MKKQKYIIIMLLLVFLGNTVNVQAKEIYPRNVIKQKETSLIKKYFNGLIDFWRDNNKNYKFLSNKIDSPIFKVAFMSDEIPSLEDKEVNNTLPLGTATFSFDTNILSLSETYLGTPWEYSLDGGISWHQALNEFGENIYSLTLSLDEVLQITLDKDIMVHIGEDVVDSLNTYTIDIKKAQKPVGFYNNDYENRIITAQAENISLTQWRLESSDNWEMLNAKSPDLSGNKTLELRTMAHGIYLPSDSEVYTFTENNQDATKSYIPINKIFPVESSAGNIIDSDLFTVIDGNRLTSWQDESASPLKYLTLKLESSKYLSALEYYPDSVATSGILTKGKIYTSMDKVNWEEVASFENLPSDNEPKLITFNKIVEALYIKVVWDESIPMANASIINLFEDTTQSSHQIKNIEYSTYAPTTGDVTTTITFASSVNMLSPNLNKLENDIYTYTFTENGVLHLEYELDGETYSYDIVMNLIDKKAPDAEVTYNLNKTTNQDVVATLKFDEVVTILGSSYPLTKVDDTTYTYTFTENGINTVSFIDAVGNYNEKTLTVDWIDKYMPEVTASYSSESITNQDVEVTLSFNKDVTILNKDIILNKLDNRTYSYTFTDNNNFTIYYIDASGNSGKYDIGVSYIDKIAPSATIDYYPKDGSLGFSTATVVPSEEVYIENNNGSVSHSFYENGEFTFVLVDKAGNKATFTAQVDFLNRKVNDKQNISNQNEYKEYSSSGVTVKLLNPTSQDNINLVKKYFELPDNFKNKVGTLSEGIELSLEDENKETININDALDVMFKLDNSKEFKGLYFVDEDVIKQVDYEKNNNTLSVKATRLGKYVLAYDEKPQVVKDYDDSTTVKSLEGTVKENKPDKKRLSIVIIGIGTILVIVIALIKHYKTKNDKEVDML